MHILTRLSARLPGFCHVALLQRGVVVLLGALLAAAITLAPRPSVAQESTGFFQRPAFSSLRATFDAGPANSPGWTNDFTQRGLSLSSFPSDDNSPNQLNMGLRASAFLGNFLRLAVGYSAVDPYGAIDDGLELTVGVGYSFSATDIGVQASYVHNFSICEDYGSVPMGRGISGFVAHRMGEFTFEVGGGVHLFTAQYPCAYEGGGWGVIMVQPRLAWQLSSKVGIGFQVQMYAGKVNPILQPKIEAVYTLPLGVSSVDISAALEFVNRDTLGAQAGLGAAIHFE